MGLGIGTGGLASDEIENEDVFDPLSYNEAERLVHRRILWELAYSVSQIIAGSGPPPDYWNWTVERAIRRVRITHDPWQPELWDDDE